MSSINVGMMTSGGLAPCLSSSIAHLVHYWSEAKKAGKISGLTIRMYRDGYKGILKGDSFLVPEETWEQCWALHDLGGSPIGNSRVKVSSSVSIIIIGVSNCKIKYEPWGACNRIQVTTEGSNSFRNS